MNLAWLAAQPAGQLGVYALINNIRRQAPGTLRRILSDDAMYIPFFKGIEGRTLPKRIRYTFGGALSPTGTNVASILNEAGLKLRDSGIKGIKQLDKSLVDTAVAVDRVGKASRYIEGKVRRGADMAAALPVVAGSTVGGVIGAAEADEKGAAIGAVLGALGGLAAGKGLSGAVKAKTSSLVKGLKRMGSKEKLSRETLADIKMALDRYVAREQGQKSIVNARHKHVAAAYDKFLKAYQSNKIWHPVKS